MVGVEKARNRLQNQKNDDDDDDDFDDNLEHISNCEQPAMWLPLHYMVWQSEDRSRCKDPNMPECNATCPLPAFFNPVITFFRKNGK